MNIKRCYQAPQLTVVTFKTERGYANSDINLVNDLAGQVNRFIEDRQMESEMWDDATYTTGTIERRTFDYGFGDDAGWNSGNGGEWF